MKKFLIILVLIGYAYSVNGTITFYDGTSLSGELSSSDTRYIFIIPNKDECASIIDKYLWY